ncbi:MAG: phosphate ABC transporter permease subunit PstC [Acutalibacteraceae bacterium]|nr:phosphate ABC transporter permease subunit PstC [Acutalibacteraceae bacterium]
MGKYKEKIMEIVFLCAALVSIAAVVLICLFLFVNGIPAMAKIGVFDFLLGTEWKPSNVPASFGIWPMILGSVYITVGAVILGVPIGIMTAIFLSRFCNKKIYKVIKPAIELLAGIPSVVYGFFGMIVLVPMVRNLFGGNGYGILTASMLLAIMILPTIISVSESAINAVPNSYYEGSLALGATKERSVFRTIVPAAKSGILAGVVLGIGRAIGETMAVILVAGNSSVIPDGILSPVRTLTTNIVLEMGYATDLHREALIATGVVLFVLILIINMLFAVIKNKGAKS